MPCGILWKTYIALEITKSIPSDGNHLQWRWRRWKPQMWSRMTSWVIPPPPKKNITERSPLVVTLWKPFVSGMISQVFSVSPSFTKHSGIDSGDTGLECMLPHSRDKTVFCLSAGDIFCMLSPISGCSIFICLIFKAT